MEVSSFQFINDENLSVDAFKLEDGSWYLFAYVYNNDPSAFVENGWKTLQEKILKDFTLGKVIGVGGAVKGKLKSIGLAFDGPAEIFAKEDDLLFLIKTRDVLNPGLFLDQKENRLFIKKNFAGRTGKVANLFSYTGAFSLACSKLGFEVTSVDFSQNYQRWELQNYKKNEVLPPLQKNMDARTFLEKTKELYAGFIIDPPSFARSPKVFQVRKDLPIMISLAFSKLEKNGFILASSNLETWKIKDFVEELSEKLPSNEFEILQKSHANSPLKFAFIQKKS